jgi:hypothetical protein
VPTYVLTISIPAPSQYTPSSAFPEMTVTGPSFEPRRNWVEVWPTCTPVQRARFVVRRNPTIRFPSMADRTTDGAQKTVFMDKTAQQKHANVRARDLEKAHKTRARDLDVVNRRVCEFVKFKGQDVKSFRVQELKSSESKSGEVAYNPSNACGKQTTRTLWCEASEGLLARLAMLAGNRHPNYLLRSARVNPPTPPFGTAVKPSVRMPTYTPVTRVSGASV